MRGHGLRDGRRVYQRYEFLPRGIESDVESLRMTDEAPVSVRAIPGFAISGCRNSWRASEALEVDGFSSKTFLPELSAFKPIQNGGRWEAERIPRQWSSHSEELRMTCAQPGSCAF